MRVAVNCMVMMGVAFLWAPVPARAQSAESINSGAAGILGGILGAAQKEQARKEWAGLGPDSLRQCLVIGLRDYGQTDIEKLAQAGLKPTDQRLSGLMQKCDQVAKLKLDQDFPCQLGHAKGERTSTRCDSRYAVQSGSGNTVVDFDCAPNGS